MSEYGLIDKEILVDIGDAVREKTGRTARIAANGLAEEIRGIDVPEEPYIEEKFNRNGNLIDVVMHGYTKIKDYGFYGQNMLQMAEIPEEITFISVFGFASCRALAITKLPRQLTFIGGSAFANCLNITISEIPQTVYYIGVKAFQNCTMLTEITFAGTPQTILSTAFEGCTNLTTINAPWSEGEVAGAPWGATNATINYNYLGGGD